MNRKYSLFMMLMGLALCALGAQSQTSFLTSSDILAKDSLSKRVNTELRHDTLHVTPEMVAELQRSQKPEEFEREIESVVFIPKGQWITGLSVSYTQSSQNKYQFFILQGVTGDTYNFKITPMVGYAFRDDMAAGLKFGYQRALTKLEKADIVLDSETSYGTDHIYSLRHNYYATMFFRNYFSIGRSKRFGFFNEIQCELGGGQSKITKGVAENLTGTYERNFSLNIGLVPGLAVFLSNYSAVEVNVGVLGFSYTDTKSTTDRIYVAHRKSKSANFRINLFSITFGCVFYL